MTKDRARKRAARERAAVTGERYVIARREAAEPSPPDGGTLHDLTHRLPGVPAHMQGGLQARVRRERVAASALESRPRRRAGAGHQNTPSHNQPRVLVGWQNRIARLFGAE